MQKLASWTRFFLFVTALTPLIVVTFAPFSFVFGKMILVRSIAGVVATLGALWFLLRIRGGRSQLSRHLFRNPIFIAVAVFILSAAVGALFAPSPYRGFFGEVDRGEGLYGLLAYFVIFLAAFFFFNEKHWRRYFRFGLLVGAFVIVHVLIRYLGLEFLPLTLGTSRQPGSFLGNPAFVASFVILLFAYAVFVYRDSSGFWKYFSLAVGLAGLIVLGLIGIRGALVGVAAGVLVLTIGSSIRSRKPWLKWGPIAVIAVLIFLGVLARTTPGSIWDGVPVFDRISRFTLESASVQSRLLSWGVSWNAFRERPFLGWGPDNYSIAYNKHYNPYYAAYSEEFFDRAHNKVFDVLVMQGIAGLLSYLAIFFALFYVLIKTKELGATRLFLSSIIIAYFVQNLFTFDHISSYLLFFAVLFFVAHLYSKSKEKGDVTDGFVPPRGRFLLQAAAAILVLAAGYSLVTWNLIPLVQAKNRTTTPYNFLQKDMRVLLGAGGGSVTGEALSALEEVALREPYDLRFKLRLAEIYNQAGVDQSEFFKRSEELIEEAERLSPRRQATRGVRAFLLSRAGNHEEAIELARETLTLEPRVPKSHYYLGLSLALSLKDKEQEDADFLRVRDEAFKELGIALDRARALAAAGDFTIFFEGDFQNTMIVYHNLEAYEELLEVYRIAEKFFPFNLGFHKVGLVAALKERNAGEVIRIAKRIRELDPASRDDMDVIVDLAGKENWEILDNL